MDAVRECADAGGAAAMLALALYFGAHVGNDERLDYVGAASPVIVGDPAHTAMRPRSLHLARLWLDRAAEAGSLEAMWTHAQTLHRMRCDGTTVAAMCDTIIARGRLEDSSERRVVVAAHLLKLNACKHWESVRWLPLLETAASLGSPSAAMMLGDFCRCWRWPKELPDWQERATRAYTSAADQLGARAREGLLLGVDQAEAGAERCNCFDVPCADDDRLRTLAAELATRLDGSDCARNPRRARLAGTTADLTRALHLYEMAGPQHESAARALRWTLDGGCAAPDLALGHGGDARRAVELVDEFAGACHGAAQRQEAESDLTQHWVSLGRVLAELAQAGDAEGLFRLAVYEECNASRAAASELNRGGAASEAALFVKYKERMERRWRDADAVCHTDVARALLERAAATGHARSITWLANATLTSPDPRGAATWLERTDDSACLLRAGVIYDRHGWPALDLWRRAAEKPDVDPVVFLYLALCLASGPDADTAAFVELVRRAASLGVAMAALLLGMLHEYRNDLVPPDLASAFHWYRAACALRSANDADPSQWHVHFGDPACQALFKFLGCGFPRINVILRDNGSGGGSALFPEPAMEERWRQVVRALLRKSVLDEAVELIERADAVRDDGRAKLELLAAAADAGHPRAVLTLLNADHAAAATWSAGVALPDRIAAWRAFGVRTALWTVTDPAAERAAVAAQASAGHAVALYQLAELHLTEGRGRPESRDRFETLAFAAVLTATACGPIRKLADEYTTGQHVPVDSVRALMLNSYGVLLFGDNDCLCRVGHAFEHGLGVDAPSLPTALALYRCVLARGQSGGLAGAAVALARMYRFGRGVLRDVDRAMRLYAMAATRLQSAQAKENKETAKEEKEGAEDDHVHAIGDVILSIKEGPPREKRQRLPSGGGATGTQVVPLRVVAAALETGQGCVWPDAAHANELRAWMVTSPSEDGGGGPELAYLSSELLQRILAYLPPSDCVRCRAVNRAWRDAVCAVEASDRPYRFACVPLHPAPVEQPQDAPPRYAEWPLMTSPCSCGGLLDHATWTSRRLVPLSTTNDNADVASYAVVHAGQLPPTRWRVAAAQRDVAQQLGLAVQHLETFYLPGSLATEPVAELVDQAADGLRVPFKGTPWSCGHVALPDGLPLPVSALQMRGFVHALLFGASTKAETLFFGPQAGRIDATSVTGAVLTERLSVRLQSNGSEPRWVQNIHIVEGPVADLSDPRHAVWAVQHRSTVFRCGVKVEVGWAGGNGRRPRKNRTNLWGQLHATWADSEGGDLGRLHARVAAVSDLWITAHSNFPDNLRRQVRHVFQKSGLVYSLAFVRRAGETEQQQAGQDVCCRELAAFAEAHLDLPVVYEVVSPTHAIVIAGFARAFGRSCVVFAISYGKGEPPV